MQMTGTLELRSNGSISVVSPEQDEWSDELASVS